MNKRVLLLALVLGFFMSYTYAQPWMYDENGTELTTFSAIQNRGNTLFSGKEDLKGSGYKPYKRWEYFWKSRLMPDGSLPPSTINEQEKVAYLKKHVNNVERMMANWTSIGPVNMPGGIGRVNCIAFHPTDPNTLWIGAPAGGIWKSSNDGASWEALNHDLPSLGVSDIAVHPTNPAILYIATGDGEIRDSPSFGVYKSTNGGQTWLPTGLQWTASNYFTIRRMVMDPNNPNVLLVAASDGIYRTADAGATWQKVRSARIHDIEFKPFSSNLIYAASGSTTGQVLKSTDNGLTWTILQTYPSTGRIVIAVTPANPNYVYWATSDPYNYSLTGVYRSTDEGQTNALRNSTVNIGSQCYYDFMLQGHPTNADELWVGGVSSYRSVDGGSTFVNAHSASMHVDVHTMAFKPDGTYYQGNDGGIYKKAAGQTAWVYISTGLEISQMYRLGLSQTDDKILAGHQDNGTTFLNNGAWGKIFGGDGMECFFDPNNSSTLYFTTQNGVLYRSINNGQTVSTIVPGGAGTGDWVTPFLAYKTSNTTHSLLAAFTNVYRSNNQGTTWTQLSDFQSTEKLDYLTYAPSDTNQVYTGRASGTMWKTTDGGTSWATVTKPYGTIQMLEIAPNDPQKLWITMDFYSAGTRVFQSNDGGDTWINVSGSLPAVPVNCIVYQKGTNDGLYIGTDIGVFYKDGSMADWEIFDQGLPNVPIRALEIDYTEGNIYAATYGRGMWKSGLFSPITQILTVSPTTLSLGSAAQNKSVTLSSTVPWSVTTKPAWLTINPTNGQGNGTIECAISENTSTNARTGQVVFSGAGLSTSVNLTQLAATINSTCSNNILNNESYENGLFSWAGAGLLATSANTGTKALKACTYLSPARQTVAIQANTNYQLSVYAKRETGTTGVVALKFMDSSWLPIKTDFFPIGSQNYTQISATSSAPINAAWAEVSVLQDGGSGCVYVDDWCLSKVQANNPCSINASAINLSCDNNGTPADPSDDTFTFALLVDGENTSNTWTTTVRGTSLTGSYNQPKVLGPYAISNGNLSFTVADQNTTTCTSEINLAAPTPCSNGSSTNCQNNLLINGDFSANTANWGSFGSVQTVKFVANNESFTGVSVQLCNAADRVYQSVNIQAGKSYTIAGQAKRGGTAEGIFALKFLDANWSPIITEFASVTENTYTYKSLTSLAPATAKYAEVSFLHGGGTNCVWADDLCFSETSTVTAAPDLALTVSATPSNPGIWKTVDLTWIIKNEGSEAATGVVVQIPAEATLAFSDKLVYVSHTAATNTTFNAWLGLWNVGTLAAGENKVLQYQGFTKVTSPIDVFAQVTAQSPADFDSAPNNNTSNIPNEDDEALIQLNSNIPLIGGQLQDLDALAPVSFVYPNPASAFIWIDLNDSKEQEVLIQLVDAYGRVLIQRKSTTGIKVQIDLEKIQSGAYFLQLKAEQTRPRSVKIIVEKGD